MSPFKAGRIINSYDDALMHFTSIAPYRNGTKLTSSTYGMSSQELSSIRPASSLSSQRRRKHQLCYLKDLKNTEHKAVVFRMYGTDVVTYNPDNSITLVPYASSTTNIFANALLPSNISVAMSGRHATLTIRSKTQDRTACTYLLLGDMTLKPCCNTYGWTVEKPPSISDIRLNTSKYFKALKKYNYNMFETWVKARMALSKDTPEDLHKRNMHATTYAQQGEAFDLATFKCFLLGSEHWNTAYDLRGKKALEDARLGIIYLSDCLERKQLDYVEGTDLRAHMRRQEKYFLIERTQRRRPKGYYLACVYGHDPECACFLGEKPYIPSDQKEDL